MGVFFVGIGAGALVAALLVALVLTLNFSSEKLSRLEEQLGRREQELRDVRGALERARFDAATYEVRFTQRELEIRDDVTWTKERIELACRDREREALEQLALSRHEVWELNTLLSQRAGEEVSATVESSMSLQKDFFEQRNGSGLCTCAVCYRGWLEGGTVPFARVRGDCERDRATAARSPY